MAHPNSQAPEPAHGTRPMEVPPSEATQVLPTQANPVLSDDPGGTQAMLVASTAVQNLAPPEAAVRTQAMAVPILEEPRAWPRWRSPLLITAGILGLVLAGWLWPTRPGVTSEIAVASSPQAVPEVLQPYLAAAQAGDTWAMRMLGTRYFYGLDVPRDPVQGRQWFQKAALAGDAVAKAELAQLGGTEGR